MKSVTFFCLLVLVCNTNAQDSTFLKLLEKGKIEFKNQESKHTDEKDYTESIELLKKAVSINPHNQEAHYFLGYAYDRMNSCDGSLIPKSTYRLSVIASEEYEKLIKINKKYKGELYTLDPYSLITSTWATLGLAYLINNQNDSAKLAFIEGKKRGGFNDFIISFAKATLDCCSNNSILLCSGDNMTYPLLYSQIAENYRTDVKVVDVNLLNTIWFPDYLQKSKAMEFTLSKAEMDTLFYMPWETKVIPIGTYSCTIKPTYEKHYILRSDILLIDYFKVNAFKKDIYFAKTVAEEQKLGISVTDAYLVEKLASSDALTSMFFKNIENYQYKKSNILKYSPDMVKLLSIFHTEYIKAITELISIGDIEKAKKIFKYYKKNIPDTNNESINKYVSYLSKKLK